MATWTTELEARVEVDEELKGALMAALVAAFPEPKPALVFGSGRLRARLEVEADHELEAARLAADRFAKALEKAILELLPRVKQPGTHRPDIAIHDFGNLFVRQALHIMQSHDQSMRF